MVVFNWQFLHQVCDVLCGIIVHFSAMRCVIVKVNKKLEELISPDTNQHQVSGFEHYLNKDVFFFPGITLW